MSAPVGLRGNFSDLYGSSQLPVLEFLFRSSIAQYPSRRDMLLNKRMTDRDIWQYSELHDLPLFSAVNEGSDYTFARSKAGASKTLTMVKYGLGVSCSEELIADGKFDMLGDMIRKLGRSAVESREISGIDLLNNGFTASTGTLTADGLSLFNTAHTLPGGLTFRNRPSTDVDLSPSALDAALSDYATQFVGDSGIKMMIKPKYLVVGSSLERYAKEIVQSSNKADTSDNNKNSFLDDNLIVVMSPHLTDGDSWHLSAGPGSLDENGLVIIEREGIQTKGAGPDVGFANDGVFYKSRYREAVGALHPYGWYGSSGA